MVARLSGRFTLRSGAVSDIYWDKYRFESDPVMLEAIVEQMLVLLPPAYDKLAGMELGGIPLATVLSLKTGRPCLYIRKKAKDYGTRNLVEGGFSAGERVVVIEDVITTAGQVCTLVKEMRELGLEIRHVLCVIDRQEGGSENLKGIGCELAPLFTLAELEVLADTPAPQNETIESPPSHP